MLGLVLLALSVSASFENGALRSHQWVTPDHLVATIPGQADNAGREPDAIMLHIFLVPPNAPAVPLDVWVDDVHVVTGYFEYGSPAIDPGEIYDFDLNVAGPTITLRAEGPDAMLEEIIDVPAERWAILHYDLDKVTSPGELIPRLRVDVSDRPVGFE